jgi:hypothetical protein
MMGYPIRHSYIVCHQKSFNLPTNVVKFIDSAKLGAKYLHLYEGVSFSYFFYAGRSLISIHDTSKKNALARLKKNHAREL